ncbi:recombinase zinc beta ribbon domain-containing protein [Alitiscatomonas sp.]|uniref:recombinase zinc beta ribbon domain-containing protein n=1 Tax=Alitiscatomonas sp. TaxID=2981647 RepID=UPI0030784F73
MACDQGGISYKSQKCLRQSPENWVVVKGTHEPIIDPEAFQKVQLLVNSRKHTRSRTYDFLLKGLIFCHECGYPMAVLNRKNAAGEDRLFFGCRAYLHPDKLCPIAKEAVENASKAASCEAEIQALQSKITAQTTNLDQMYTDRLSGLLLEEDFQRIYQKVKMDRTVLEDRLKSLQSSR